MAQSEGHCQPRPVRQSGWTQGNTASTISLHRSGLAAWSPMTRLGLCAALVSVGASMLSARTEPPHRVHATATAPRPALQAPDSFQKYCFECHGGSKHKGGVSIERLIQRSTQTSAGDYWDDWDKIPEMLESRQMPPKDEAERCPTADQRP